MGFFLPCRLGGGGVVYVALKINSLAFSSSQHGVTSIVTSNELRSEVGTSVTVTSLYLSAYINAHFRVILSFLNDLGIYFIY